MGKENNVASGQLRDYPAAALYLARSYGNMMKERDYIEKVLSGEYQYTEDDALQELISTTASTESDTGVRVQTSNISNTTERIGLLLADGFVEKRNKALLQEVLKDMEGRRYLYWKLDVVETAMRERMTAEERGIFKRMFVKRMTYKQMREAYHKKKLYNRILSAAKKSILQAIADEVELRDCQDAELEMVSHLFSDVL